MNLVGWDTNGSIIFGFASEFKVTSSVIQIPVVGIGFLSDGALSFGAGTSNLRVHLESPLASTLTVDLKNLTTGNTLGSATIAAGNLSLLNAGSMPAASGGDQVVLLLSVSGSDEILQGISWFIS